MAKICITKREKNKNCATCAHNMYEVEYEQYCCYAQPNAYGEVEWEPKEAEKR